MLRGCGVCCACSASGFWPVQLPQARSRVPVPCICCAGIPGFCMMPGWCIGRAGCTLGAAACGCVCAFALRVGFGPFRSRKPARVVSAWPCFRCAGCRVAEVMLGWFAGLAACALAGDARGCTKCSSRCVRGGDWAIHSCLPSFSAQLMVNIRHVVTEMSLVVLVVPS